MTSHANTSSARDHKPNSPHRLGGRQAQPPRLAEKNDEDVTPELELRMRLDSKKII